MRCGAIPHGRACRVSAPANASGSVAPMSSAAAPRSTWREQSQPHAVHVIIRTSFSPAEALEKLVSLTTDGAHSYAQQRPGPQSRHAPRRTPN
eukprot:3614620-Prymnesium_polylepis.1